MISVAVIGAGSMGKNHIRVFRGMPDVELIAVVDSNPEAREQISHLYCIPTYSSYQEMLERERPDAVSVVVPSQLHFTVTKYLLEAGCHVLVEKPIATNLDDARDLVATAERMDRILAVGHVERFNPAILELKRRLDAVELGTIFQIYARRLGPFPSRIQDVGVIMDLATHDLDVMRFLTGRNYVRVHAETRQVLNRPHEDLLTGIIRFEDNMLGLLEINWITPTKIRELYVTGERGMFKVNYITQDLTFFENAETNGHAGWQALSLLRGVSEGNVMQFALQKKEPLRSELENFISGVRGDRSNIVYGWDAIQTLAFARELVTCAYSDAMGEVTVP